MSLSPGFRPKLLETLKTYTREDFHADVVAGVTVGIVALPLAMAFAIASGVPPQAGIFTAVIAGMLISGLGGTKVGIGGPTGAFIVILYGIYAKHGAEELAVCTIMAGGLLFTLGLARFGTMIKYIPYPVTAGFTSGIAVLIFSTQIKDFCGLSIAKVPSEFFPKMRSLVEHLGTFQWPTLLMAAASLAVIRLWPGKWNRRVPGSIFALILATVTVGLFHLPVETIGSRFGGIPHGLPAPHLPSFAWGDLHDLVHPAVTIALLAAIESLLCAVVADGMIDDQHDSNQELMAQGTANIVSPLFGGIAVTGAIARTATNVKCGGRTPVAGITHGITLLLIILVAAPLARFIPLATLSAVLINVALNMGEWHNFGRLLKWPRSDAAVFLSSFGLTVIIDLTVAVETSMVLAAMLFIKRVADTTQITAVDQTTETEGAHHSLVGKDNFPAVFDGTNSIYVFGGYTDSTSGIESASVLRYSVSKNTWTNLASLPVSVAGSAAAMGADGKIYVVGGLSGGVTTNLVQVYTPASNAWAIVTPLPEGLSAAAMGVDSLGRLIVMGGMDENTNDVSDVWRSQQLGVPDSPPVFTSFPGTNAVYTSPYSSSLTATGNPQPVYLLVDGPTNMMVNYYSGAITWTPQGLNETGAIPVTIRATNFAGTADLSFIINVPNPKPAVPTNVYEAASSETSVTLAWDPENPAYGLVTYGIYIPHPYHSPKGGGGVTYQLVASTTNTSYTFTGLTPNSAYSYDINATGPGGTSGYAGVSARTTGPQPPQNFRITGVTSTTISLAWDPGAGPVAEVRYAIVGWVGGLFPTISYGTNFTNTTATITGLTPGTYEEWTVSGYDASGNQSGYGGGLYAVNPAAAPAQLSSAMLTPGGFQLTVSEGGNSLQTVLIEATTNPADPNAWVQIGSVLPAVNPFSFIDTNSSQYTTRFYRVVAP